MTTAPDETVTDEPLRSQAAMLAAEMTTGIVAIDGPSGAGKSTFADLLVEELAARGTGVALVRTDHYATWDNPAAWWPDFETEIIHPFLRRRDYAYRPLMWDADGIPTPGAKTIIRWQPLLVIEGVTSARRRIADRLTHSLWLDGGDATTRLERAVARDGEINRDNLIRWQNFERGWYAVDATRARCRIVD